MASNACRAINVFGTIYIATGPLTNFLENVTLNPGRVDFLPGQRAVQARPVLRYHHARR